MADEKRFVLEKGYRLNQNAARRLINRIGSGPTAFMELEVKMARRWYVGLIGTVTDPVGDWAFAFLPVVVITTVISTDAVNLFCIRVL